MTRSAGPTIDIQQAWERYAVDLRRFILGVLRNESLADDALQATFLKLAEKADTLRDSGAVRSWLFQVAFNESMLVKRKAKVSQRHQEKVAWRMDSIRESPPAADELALSKELAEQVRLALDQLSAPQREVVQKRIYEGLKFREIAEELNVPLGTVLARMQASLKKLRPVLEPNSDDQ